MAGLLILGGNGRRVRLEKGLNLLKRISDSAAESGFKALPPKANS
jgi:hypothetical protein